MRPIIRFLVLMLLMAAPGWAAAQSVTPVSAPESRIQRTERIEAELVPMTLWAARGGTAIVAVRQKIRPGWHTYWRNPGDSGGATTLDWTLPTGVTAGDIVWPLPERQPLSGLMNYGYSGDVYLPVPIEVPASVSAGSTLPLTVKALFLVCSAEMCVPDELTLSLDLPIGEGAALLDPVHGAAIQTIVETAPRPASIEARVALENGRLVLTATGGPLAGVDPGPVYFFPFTGGVINHAAVQTGSFGAEGIRLSLAPGGATTNGVTGSITGVLSTARGAFEITAEPGAALDGTTGQTLCEAPLKSEAGAPAIGLWQAALFALIGGLILNLMPCVFPILAMKAASLTRSAHDPAEARRDGVAFTLGVLAAFVALAGVLIALKAAGQAAGWGFQLQSPMVTASLALLMLAIGLNLSGVFEIGQSLQGAGGGRLSRLPGGAGAFFTGVLAVVVAAPCTAPFMAAALGTALVLPWPLTLVVFALLGLGLALPYLLISLSPRLLAGFPKPGPWMETLRNVLAFPMYGAALWLAWVFSRQSGAEPLALLFAAGLLLALGLWLWGRDQARPAPVWKIAAAIAVTAALAATVGAAKLPPEPQTTAASSEEDGGALASQPWSPEAVAAAQAEGRPVLVNFTADWCVSCKINERTSIRSAEVREAMAAANAVYLVGDWTRRDDVIAAELERHGRSGVPLYLVYAPGSAEPRILPQLLTPGLVAEAINAASS